MSEKSYARSNDGIVHLVSAINGEFTIYGNAFDGDANNDPDDPHAWSTVKRGPVTCGKCATEILNCRNVKISLL